MELQFQKSEIRCLQSVIKQLQTQELTQEMKLSEGMPDIGRVITSWGQLIIRGKEWRTGGMHISGGVMVWTLYIPEDGAGVQSVESWLPMQMKWEFPATERDGVICAMPILRSVDARCISARKMMVRAGVGVCAEGLVPQQIDLYTPSEIPEDVQLLQHTYPALLPKEAGEKAFSLDVDISLPASAPPLEKLLSYDLRTELRESKLVSDKLVFRGVALVHLRYISPDGQVNGWELEVPFSQYAELDNEYTENGKSKICFAVTGLDLEPGQEENLTLKAGLIGQYIIYDQCLLELAEDAYSPTRQVKGQMEELSLPAVLEMKAESVDVDKDVLTQCARITDATFYPDYPMMHSAAGEMTAELSGTVQLLGYDTDGALQTTLAHWDTELRKPSEVGMDITTQQIGPVSAAVGGENANIHAQLQMETMATMESKMPMLTGLELGEAIQPDPDRPSVVLCRTEGATLWELAKKFGSTVDAISRANALQQDPDEDQMLLIPIS